MSKVIDISNKRKEIIHLINNCITLFDELHISASTPQGPASRKDLIYIFNELTDKPIENFKFMKTDRALYLVENKPGYKN